MSAIRTQTYNLCFSIFILVFESICVLLKQMPAFYKTLLLQNKIKNYSNMKTQNLTKATRAVIRADHYDKKKKFS